MRAVSLLVFISCLSFGSLHAQTTTKADTVKKFKPNFRPASFRFGTDIYGLVKSQVVDHFTGWEVTADTEIHRYLLVADFGSAAEKLGDDSVSYENSGNYWRVGIDANFLTRDPDKNVFFLGIRYARAKYDEQMSVITDDNIWGSVTRDYQNNGMKANWLELTGGLKVRMFKQFWMGYTARFKFSLDKNDDLEMITHNVPGYGTTNRETSWGFSYYVFYRIPFRPTTSILPPKKKK